MAEPAPSAPEDTLDTLGRMVRAGVSGAVPIETYLVGRQRFVRRSFERTAPPTRRLARAVAVAAVLVCALGGGWLMRRGLGMPRQTRGVEAHVVAAASHGEIAAGASDAELHFDDGTEVVLRSRSRVRVAEQNAHDANVVLLEGRLVAHVVHHDDTHWQVHVGSLVVWVTGTRFEVAWDPAHAVAEVSLFEGSVTVQDGSEHRVRLSPGQRLLLSNGTLTLDGGPIAPDARTPPDEVTSPDPSATTVDFSGSPHGTRSGHPPTRPPPDWTASLSHGDFAAVVSAARAEGIDVALARRGPDELSALGDAARYLHQLDLARAALDALRRRFATNPRARTAAFTLGRIAEDGGHATDAAHWFETYRSESPNGPLAAAALGRWMVVEQQRGRTESARQLATEYLQCEPNGPFAEAARRLSRL